MCDHQLCSSIQVRHAYAGTWERPGLIFHDITQLRWSRLVISCLGPLHYKFYIYWQLLGCFTHTHTRTFMLFKVPIVTDVLLKGHFDHFDRFGHFDTYNLKLITFLSFFLDLLVILPRRHSFKGWNWISLDVPRSFELVWMFHSWMFEIQSNPANPANPTRQTSVSAFCCRRLARQWGRSALGTSTCYLTLDKAPDSGTPGLHLINITSTVTDCHRLS